MAISFIYFERIIGAVNVTRLMDDPEVEYYLELTNIIHLNPNLAISVGVGANLTY